MLKMPYRHAKDGLTKKSTCCMIKKILHTIIPWQKQLGRCWLIRSQSSLAYAQLKDMIFRMELLPGTRIPELQISAKLSISRTPIHDALRRLESEGLVTISQNRGATVSCFSEAEIKEIGVIRLYQDILSAQLASYYGSAADFDRLFHLAEICEETAAKGDIYGRIQTDCDFHLAIAQISRNSRLISQQETIYQQIHLIQISQYIDVAHSLAQIHHHKPIVEAIRNGETDKVRALFCEHLKDFYHLNSYVIKCCSSTYPTSL